MKKYLISALFLALALFINAVPARRDWHQVTLADGSQVAVRQAGDEFYHYWMTADGRMAEKQADGSFILTGAAPSREQVAARREASPLMQGRKVGAVNLAPRGLLILVNFADRAFRTENNQKSMDSVMNYTGYAYNGATGCAAEYFRAQSNNLYQPVFDVVGPVTLDNNMKYYGENNSAGNDKNAAQMIVDACKKVDSQVDFTLYDNDNDGSIDFVYVMYAGLGENETEEADAIWAHNWYVKSAGKYEKFDGLWLDNYACSGELTRAYNANYEIIYVRNGIGTLCHEFGHVIGLPDYYDADGNKNGNATNLTPNEWSIMDYGCYNNVGNTPPNYSIYDKGFMGWANIQDLHKDAKADMTLTTDYGSGYRIPGGNGVYYFIENRQLQGWDRALYAHGMLVWRVEYNESAWYNNQVNIDPNNVRYTLVSADNNANHYVGYCWYYDDQLADYVDLHYSTGDPYPTGGSDNITFGEGFVLSDIKETNGVITFKLNGGADEPTGLERDELSVKSEKMLRDGQLIILRGEKEYNAAGVQMK